MHLQSSKFSRIVFITLFVSLLALPLSAVLAGTLVAPVTMGVTCTGITFTGGGELAWDRDNTGTGLERLVLEARDGSGNVIFYAEDTRSVGTSAIGFSPIYPYASAPQTNSITARLYSPAGNGLSEQMILSVTGDCPGLPSANPPGPAIPEGFVLRTIICETPVYNMVDGQAVAGSVILAGQTWYVDPTPVAGSDGELWTEIFTAGWVNGFISTDCIGG
ncbi:MAG: hypothetical protein IPK17_18540 [Chloroflexi bacterium]|uniref:hypothetical protein n=1 Tax=Candidatus Flexifilum breve TaxID=3140694 RepID=UPI003134B8BF|nr:hypothetical protein [Chloroflexota bacterium]